MRFGKPRNPCEQLSSLSIRASWYEPVERAILPCAGSHPRITNARCSSGCDAPANVKTGAAAAVDKWYWLSR